MLLGIAACTRPVDDQGHRLVDIETNPEFLPYRFVRIGGQTGLTHPLTLDARRRQSVYGVQNNWRPREGMSSILFGRDVVEASNDINQYNIYTELIISNHADDLDGDGVDEVAVTYLTGDSLWLEVIDAFDDSLWKTCLVAGVDHNGDGYWDGTGYVMGSGDVAGDSCRELFVSCYSGYDLYPRKIMCIDWSGQTILWEFPVAGHSGGDEFAFLPAGDTTGPLILFKADSPCNGAATDLMDDMHSYLICLNADGTLRWLRERGGGFSLTRFIPFDFRDDGSIDIIATYSFTRPDGLAAGGITVISSDGETLDSIQYPVMVGAIYRYDHNGDGDDELLVDRRDKTIYVYTPSLEVTEKYAFSEGITLYDCRDFLNRGAPQYLAHIYSGALCLFSNDFRHLARLDGVGEPVVMPSVEHEHIIITHELRTSDFYVPARIAWYRGFVIRYKNHLLLGLGALAAGLIVSLLYQRKTKRNLNEIARQRSDLEQVHVELQEMQRRLIAAEKYRQAKDIAGGFAHEIRNALFPAKSALSRLKRAEAEKLGEAAWVQDLARDSDRAVSRAVELTQQISQYTGLEAAIRIESVDVEKIVDTALRLNRGIISEAGIDIRLDKATVSPVSGNGEQFLIAVNNVLINAIDAVASIAEPGIHISLKETGDNVRLEISDNGPGVPPENRQRIFDMFFTTKPDTGTGLGLTTTKAILALYGGTISITVSNKFGATFILTFQKIPPEGNEPSGA